MPAATFQTDYIRLVVDDQGRATVLEDRATGRNLLAQSQALANVTHGETSHPSTQARLEGERLTLSFGESETQVVLRILERAHHLVVEVEQVRGE